MGFAMETYKPIDKTSIATAMNDQWIVVKMNGRIHGLGEVPQWLINEINKHYVIETKGDITNG